MDKCGFKFKGIIQNENKDECNIVVTSNDEQFLKEFRRIIKREFQIYNAKLKQEYINPIECIHLKEYEMQVTPDGETRRAYKCFKGNSWCGNPDMKNPCPDFETKMIKCDK